MYNCLSLLLLLIPFSSSSSSPASAVTPIKIMCIGDSITAGAFSSGNNATYPSVLQRLLDAQYGAGIYKVYNYGASGATMLARSDDPYWTRGPYIGLFGKNGPPDIAVIMFGTNDAKGAPCDVATDCPKDYVNPQNWQSVSKECDICSLSNDPTTSCTKTCGFAQDYTEFVGHILQYELGVKKIYLAVPPPLHRASWMGMNQTVINDILPMLIPNIAKANNVTGVINVFEGMGGTSDWRNTFPSKCTQNSTYKECNWWCDGQSCDQCHPNDNGYAQLAHVVKNGLGL